MNHLWQWFNMGGYGGYVWSAYGLVGVVFIANILILNTKKNKIRHRLQHWFKN